MGSQLRDSIIRIQWSTYKLRLEINRAEINLLWQKLLLKIRKDINRDKVQALWRLIIVTIKIQTKLIAVLTDNKINLKSLRLIKSKI